MCCGGARTTNGPSAVPTDRGGAQNETGTVRFTYVGRTRLGIVGGATAKLYRFEGPGAIVEVDPRDAYGLSTVPQLRRVL